MPLHSPTPQGHLAFEPNFRKSPMHHSYLTITIMTPMVLFPSLIVIDGVVISLQRITGLRHHPRICSGAALAGGRHHGPARQVVKSLPEVNQISSSLHR